MASLMATLRPVTVSPLPVRSSIPMPSTTDTVSILVIAPTIRPFEINESKNSIIERIAQATGRNAHQFQDMIKHTYISTDRKWMRVVLTDPSSLTCVLKELKEDYVFEIGGKVRNVQLVGYSPSLSSGYFNHKGEPIPADIYPYTEMVGPLPVPTITSEHLITDFVLHPVQDDLKIKWETKTVLYAGTKKAYISFNVNFPILEDLVTTVASLMSFEHANICKVIGIVRNPNTDSPIFYGIMWEIGEDGWTCSNQAMISAFSDSHVISFARATGSALQYIHSKGFIHTNVKPDLILMDPTKTKFKVLPPIAMMSTSVGATMTGMRGSPMYMCPALAQKRGFVTTAIDVHSFAISICEVMIKISPFKHVVVSSVDDFFNQRVMGAIPYRLDGLIAGFGKKPTLLGYIIVALSNTPSERPSLDMMMTALA